MLRIVAALALVALVAAPASAQEMRRITVQGEGAVSAAPDMAEVTIGVETLEASADEAFAGNGAQTSAVIDAVKAAGIEEADIQTSDISIQPRFSNPSEQDAIPTVVGYQVTNEVRVKVRDADALGGLLDGVVGAGANRIYGITFGFSDLTSLEDEARQEAVADAMRKGTLYAEAAGVTLGDVHAISEDVASGGPRPFAEARMMAATPVVAGQKTVSATVSMTWTIAD